MLTPTLLTARLKTLSAYLRSPAVTQTNFDLRLWKSQVRSSAECGTVGCAVGHAGDIPEFRDAGLRIEFPVDGGVLTPTFGGKEQWPAVETFFGLTEEQALWLFSADCYLTENDRRRSSEIPAREVADRIDAFLADPATVPTEEVRNRYN